MSNDGHARLIYEHGCPYGIRNDRAFILFFRQVTHFPNQEERYQRELAEQRDTAEFITNALNERVGLGIVQELGIDFQQAAPGAFII